VEAYLAVVVGAVFAGGFYLVMRRNLLRFVFGLILLSSGVNLLVFTTGRVSRGAPPIIPAGAAVPVGEVANALPHALILTAIVIGFGLTVFAMVLLLRLYERLGTLRTDQLTERLGAPQPVPGLPDEEAPA
jgi:multicomponent Na+:H+ antiporter subunit C